MDMLSEAGGKKNEPYNKVRNMDNFMDRIN